MAETVASSAPEGDPAALRLHLLVYGKLIRGGHPDGPIRPGTEHRITGLSADFPGWLQPHCTPEGFFRRWGGVTAVDAGLFEGGAFVYRPVRMRIDGNAKFVGLFARIQARSEGGRGKPGRRYTHCAVLAVEDEWRPELIPLAADFLFGECKGDRCFGAPNTERQQDRMSIALPQYRADSLPSLPGEARLDWHAEPAEAAARDFSVRHFCQGRLQHRQPRECAGAAGAYLRDHELAGEGRWLSFGFGVSVSAIGLHDGFALVGDSREDEALDPITLQFSDTHPYASPDLIDGDFDWKKATARVPAQTPAASDRNRDPAMFAQGEAGPPVGEPAVRESVAAAEPDGAEAVAGVAGIFRRGASASPNRLAAYTRDFVHINPQVQEFVRDYRLDSLFEARNVFQRRMSKLRNNPDDMLFDEQEQDYIFYYIDDFLNFIFLYSLKNNPLQLMSLVLDAFHIKANSYLKIDSTNKGSAFAKNIEIIMSIYKQNSKDDEIFNKKFQNEFAEEKRLKAEAGDRSATISPNEDLFFRFVGELTKFPGKGRKFDPLRDDTHRMIYDNLKRSAWQVLAKYGKIEDATDPVHYAFGSFPG